MRGERSFRALQVVSALAFLGVLWTGGGYVWWRWLDPIFPDIKILHAEIHEREVQQEAGTRRRVFEVIRVVEAGDDFRATLFAHFEKPPPETPFEFDGRTVVRDPLRHSMPGADVVIERGVHQRDRMWETWALIEPGDWVYRASLRACNPVRCADLPFPPLPLTIR